MGDSWDLIGDISEYTYSYHGPLSRKSVPGAHILNTYSVAGTRGEVETKAYRS